ncbi:hypothetical protein F2Q69_00035442 [Brassica cretica]|uniref:Uncharacterized protein n=2 Tax=Brassica TaxID=3705 RepID=A0A8S9SN28_BRACR|nr:hypothetical protein F2Q69_00035442 [Brassica cretica]
MSPSLLLRRAFMAIVAAVCNMQTNQLCLTLINPDVYYDPVRVINPKTSNTGVNTGFIAAWHCKAACHCDYEYEYKIKYSRSIDIAIHPPIDSMSRESINIRHASETFALPAQCYPSFKVATQPQTLIDYHYSDTISRQGNYFIGNWAENRLHESFAVDTELPEMKSDEYDKDYHREKDIEYHSLAMDDRGLLHTLFASATSTSIDSNIKPSIDDHPTTNLEVQVKDNTNYGYPTPDEFGIFRDSEGQSRVMDGHILHISNEDIAEIIAMNGCSNFYIPKNRSDDLPSIDDAEAPSIDGHFESRRSILHPNRKRKPRWENTEVSIPTVPEQNNYNKTELMRDRYDSENLILKQNRHHRSTERLDDRSTVTMQHYEASWTSQNQHMPDLEYNNAALGVFNIGCMQTGLSSSPSSPPENASPLCSRIRTQQYPEQQPITAQRQQRFSVLIGAFAIRVRFVTVFMYLDLSQRSLSDNDYNEMVVVVYGEKTDISVWLA